jgi:hypothetical protein
MTRTVKARGGLLVAAVTLFLLVFLASTVAAQARPLKLDGVSTKVTLTPATLQVLLGADIIPFPVAPSPVVGTADSLKYTFPVTGGTVDSKTLVGTIRHSGGVLFVKWDGTAWDTLQLTRFTIVIRANEAYITAKVNGGDRLRVLELSLTDAQIRKFSSRGRAFVSIRDVVVNLNATSIGALNATFSLTLPTDAVIQLGEADVLARVWRPWH